MAGSNAGALQRSRPVQNTSQTHDFIQNPLRHFALAHFRKREVASIAGKERHNIGIVIEPRAFRDDIVCNNQIGVLRGKLFPRVFSRPRRQKSGVRSKKIPKAPTPFLALSPWRFPRRLSATAAARMAME